PKRSCRGSDADETPALRFFLTPRVSVVNKVLEFFLSLACPCPSGDPKSPFHSSEAKVLSPRAASYTMKTSMPCSPKNIVAATAALKVADAFCRGTDG